MNKIKYLKYKIIVFISALKFYLYNSFLTHFPIYSIRTLYLRHVLNITVGKHTAIHMGCYFAGSNIEIGSNSVINRNCYLDGRSGKIVIKNNVSISINSFILTVSHVVNDPYFRSFSGEVLIDDYSWIGIRSTIMPNVHIGTGVIVGANSVVTKDVEHYKIVAGTPAKVIGERKRGLNYTLNYFPLFNTDIT